MSNCKHKRSKGFEMPMFLADYVEVCLDCGMSRSVWEQGDSDWMEIPIYIDMVRAIDSITKLKTEFEELGLDKLTTNFRR